jgi:hypothetical protein
MDARHTPVIVGSSYKVGVERCQGKLWLHCDVENFTPSVAKELRAKWRQFIASVGQDVYALRNMSEDSPKEHFLCVAGFERVNKVAAPKRPGEWEIWKLRNIWAA